MRVLQSLKREVEDCRVELRRDGGEDIADYVDFAAGVSKGRRDDRDAALLEVVGYFFLAEPIQRSRLGFCEGYRGSSGRWGWCCLGAVPGGVGGDGNAVDKDRFGYLVKSDHDRGGVALGFIPGVVGGGPEVVVDLLVLGGDDKGVVGVDGVVLEVVGEGAEDELVHDVALADFVVGVGFVVAGSVLVFMNMALRLWWCLPPVCKILRRVVQSVEPVSTNETDSIRQNCFTRGIVCAKPTSRRDRRLGFLDNQPGIHLDRVRRVIQVPQFLGHHRVGVDILKSGVLGETHESPELIEGSHIPVTRLLDAQDLYRLEHVRYPVGTERAGNVLNGLGEYLH